MTDSLDVRSQIVLRCQGLSKHYPGVDGRVLQNISLIIHSGEQLAIVGSSGSGKSTLLHLLGGLDTPSTGEVTLMGQSLNSASEEQKGSWRNQYLGFVYQFHHLLPEFTAQENVAMPLIIRKIAREQAMQSAADMLKKVGLQHRLAHLPGELSGGERQRTALARALITEPKCVLADEPTGNLDRQTAASMFDLLLELNQARQTSLVVVTHDLQLASRLQTQWHLQDGMLHSNP